MSATFKTIEHTADIGVEVEAAGEPELFEGAGLAMFSLMADVSRVRPSGTRHLSLEAGDHVELMFRWLNELLFISDSEKMLLSDFDVEIREGGNGMIFLEADAAGERMDEHRHSLLQEIKAATYHEMEVSLKEGRWFARVIFDV